MELLEARPTEISFSFLALRLEKSEATRPCSRFPLQPLTYHFLWEAIFKDASLGAVYSLGEHVMGTAPCQLLP